MISNTICKQGKAAANPVPELIREGLRICPDLQAAGGIGKQDIGRQKEVPMCRRIRSPTVNGRAGITTKYGTYKQRADMN